MYRDIQKRIVEGVKYWEIIKWNNAMEIDLGRERGVDF